MDQLISMLRNALDNAYIAAGEKINAAAMTAEDRAAAIAKDPEFRRAAQEWDQYVNSVRDRQQPKGMLPTPRPQELKGREKPAPVERPFKGGVPSFVRG